MPYDRAGLSDPVLVVIRRCLHYLAYMCGHCLVSSANLESNSQVHAAFTTYFIWEKEISRMSWPSDAAVKHASVVFRS